jgi:MerR family transcriptional regulator/heat shock protein HspR
MSTLELYQSGAPSQRGVDAMVRDMGLDRELYFISAASEMLGMHPQTLRKYERLGLIQPTRTIGSMRLYSREQLERLRLIKHLVDELGINLAGVQRLLSISEVMQRIQPLMDESALATGAGRRQLVSEMRRLSDMIGL